VSSRALGQLRHRRQARVAGDSETPFDRPPSVARYAGSNRELRGVPKAARTCPGLHAFAHYVGYSPLTPAEFF